MRYRLRYLILGLALTAAPIGIVVTAPPAGADCNYAGGTTICAQGEVRGADGVPRAATPVVPYPCEYDWYCGTDSDIDVGWDPGPEAACRYRSSGPSRWTVQVEQLPHDPSTTR